jgi:oligopeptide/dipeptide ABC transporter ATP-binding protein
MTDTAAPPSPLLTIRDLTVDFDTSAGPVRVIDGVSLDVRQGEVLCLVGESGSGKSVTLLAATGLLPHAARVVSGEARLIDTDLLRADALTMRALRGKTLSMIFQDPLSSLNPVMRIGDQIGEILSLHHRNLSRAAVLERVLALMTQVGIADPATRRRAYPHEFSGGMRQRVMIAMAMANEPMLLVADEPTTALDVTVQAQVLALLDKMRTRSGSAVIFVTHDLGVVADIADRVAVMYAGRVVEQGEAGDVLGDPRHPYTAGLLASRLPDNLADGPAYAIPGQPPTAASRPSGCAFHPRCGLSAGRARCGEAVPGPVAVGNGRTVACWFPEEVPAFAAALRAQGDAA